MKFNNLSGKVVSDRGATAFDSTTCFSLLSPRKIRIVMYSHDTYGLGHLTRTVRLAQGIVNVLQGASVLIISGSPVAHSFVFPRGVDYVKLPSLVKTGPESYMARDLDISSSSLRRLRSAIILDTIKVFRPHLFFVDNVPLGMKGELRPILRWLRDKQPHVRIHLNLRDILDHPDVILPLWEEQGVKQAIQEFYDAVHVFGCREIYDAVAAYGLPEEKTEHLGYIAPVHSNIEKMDRKEKTRTPQGEDGKWHILVTAGGGGDGHAIFRSVLGIQKSLGPPTPFQFFMVAGPLMDPESYREIHREAEGVKGVYLQNNTENLSPLMTQCPVFYK